MTDLNNVVLIGRLTHDVGERDFGYTTGGTARLNVSIAVNRPEKRGGEWSDKANFFDVTVWGKTAENIRPFLRKGKQIAVSGYLDQQRWEKDGQKFSKICVVANGVNLLGGGDGQDGGRRRDDAVPEPEQGYQDSGGMDYPDDLPF